MPSIHYEIESTIQKSAPLNVKIEKNIETSAILCSFLFFYPNPNAIKTFKNWNLKKSGD